MLDWRGRGESPTGSIIQPCRAKEPAQDFHTPVVNKEPFDALSASKTWMTTQSCDHRAAPAVHTYTVATHRVSPVDIYKVTLLMERRPLDKRKQYVHLQRQRYGKMCSHFSIDLNAHTHKWTDLPAARTHFCEDRRGLYSTSLSLSPVLSTQRNSERQKNMSCKREPIVPWREQMEPPTNHWALHSPAFLKKQRHKQQHWLCSPIKRLCFYIHSGILTKMWRCPCAVLQAEIRLCVTNARWARHGNPQTEIVHTPPRYRLLNASPRSRSQSVGLTIPSWACVPAGELGEKSLRISEHWN